MENDTVSLYFMLTGLMSLVSVVSAHQTTIWRLAFGIAGGLGLLETAAALLRGEPEREGRIAALLALRLPLYAIVVAVAVHPTVAVDVGVQLTALETEATLVSLLIFVGVNYAWLLSRKDDQ